DRSAAWYQSQRMGPPRMLCSGCRGVSDAPCEQVGCLQDPKRNKPGLGGRSEVEVDSGATGRVTRELSQEGARGGRRPQGEDLRRGRQRQVSSGLQLRK